MKKITGIYKIENICNHKVYIGQSIDIARRWIGHKECLNRNKHQAHYLQNAWNKYGADKFVFAVLEECAKEDLVAREQYWIDYYGGINSKNTYNSRKAGNSGTFSDDVIQKLSQSHMGKNKGKKIPWLEHFDRWDKEYRKSLSDALTGKKKSASHAKHISEGRKGIIFSEEHKQNISKSKKGIGTSLKGRKKFEKDGIVKWVKPEDFQVFIENGWKEYHKFDTGTWVSQGPWNKGIACSEASKKHLSEVNKGKKLSEETKKKMSDSRKGMIWINNGIKSTRIRPEEWETYKMQGWTKGFIKKA